MHFAVGLDLGIKENVDHFWFERLSFGSSMYAGSDSLEFETLYVPGSIN